MIQKGLYLSQRALMSKLEPTVYENRSGCNSNLSFKGEGG